MQAVLIFALAALMAGGAIALFVYAGRRERQEEVVLRLRAGDDGGGSSTVVSDAELPNPLVRWACHLLWRAGSDVKPATVSKIMLVLSGMIPVTVLIFGWGRGLTVVAGVMLLGLFILTRQAAKRRAQIVEQLPTFLESVMRVLAAGNTLEEAIAAGARESPDPLRTLFMSVSRQARLGAPIDVVMAGAATIHKIRDLRVLALAANINRKYGGTLRNVFRSLIQAIRMREAAARELRALTAETRFSAMVLAALPVLVSTFIYFKNKAFYDDILSTPSGRVTMLVAVVLQGLGMFFIYRMMKSTQDPEG